MKPASFHWARMPAPEEATGTDTTAHPTHAPTDAFLADLRDWQLATFPDETVSGVQHHLIDELFDLNEELDADPAAPAADGELADCLMLLCCLCWRTGRDPIALMRAKHAINLQRSWPKTARGFRHVPEPPFDQHETEATA